MHVSNCQYIGKPTAIALPGFSSKFDENEKVVCLPFRHFHVFANDECVDISAVSFVGQFVRDLMVIFRPHCRCSLERAGQLWMDDTISCIASTQSVQFPPFCMQGNYFRFENSSVQFLRQIIEEMKRVATRIIDFRSILSFVCVSVFGSTFSISFIGERVRSRSDYFIFCECST